MKQLDFILPAALELENDFLTDHNRSELAINNNRIVNDIRTQFGDLRRYYRADKKSFSVFNRPEPAIPSVLNRFTVSLTKLYETSNNSAVFLKDFFFCKPKQLFL